MSTPRRRRPLQAVALSLVVIFTLFLSGLLSPRPTPRYAVTDLGVLPGDTESSATAINSRDVAVDSSQGASKGACLFVDGRVMSLGTLPGGSESGARALNSAGDVAGVAILPTGDHAFVYSGGKMQDLNDLISKGADWILEEAHSINDRGQIVGKGLHGGRERGFLLTPR